MTEVTEDPLVQSLPRRILQGRLLAFAIANMFLVLCFSRPLFELARLSFADELYSHLLLIPLISGYLIWMNRGLLTAALRPDRKAFPIFAAAGFVALGASFLANHFGTKLVKDDLLALTITAFLLFFGAVCSWCLGRQIMRCMAFPFGFLVFMIPLPDAFLHWFESFLQNESAAAALAFFRIVGTPVFYHDLTFQLPGISIEVAPQCSGIHSSVALFIISLLAGYLFLQKKTNRWILAAAVIPLAVLRNGFRIFTIGELCVHVGPQMIDSEIHHHGGPVFFALSLVPFLALLYFLTRSERRARGSLPSPR
jgi:exosortase C (VPDSG-CTERM-specific)